MHMKQHTVHLFDGELSHLHCLVLEMAGLVIDQLDRAMLSLDQANVAIAEGVVLRDREINDYELKIDAEVLTILAKRSPVAFDLRMVISISKIVVDLERIGDETVKIAKLIMDMFDPQTSDPNPQLLRDIVKMGAMARSMLRKAIDSFDTGKLENAYDLVDGDWNCDQEFQDGIRRQLTFVIQDARLIGRALEILQIMKALERCGDHCINIAEFMIFMVEGKDIRHQNR
ncbi:MAG: phosphate signaling complex protein PhoU [Methylomicrobium sp.]